MIRANISFFFYDLWSNIHYGFIGKAVGFTEWELTAGAGAVQLKDNNRSWGAWVSQYLKIELRNLGMQTF
ncbi:polymorphic toxin type 44 domain-containing protein [Prevotella sp.]